MCACVGGGVAGGRSACACAWCVVVVVVCLCVVVVVMVVVGHRTGCTTPPAAPAASKLVPCIAVSARCSSAASLSAANRRTRWRKGRVGWGRVCEGGDVCGVCVCEGGERMCTHA